MFDFSFSFTRDRKGEGEGGRKGGDGDGLDRRGGGGREGGGDRVERGGGVDERVEPRVSDDRTNDFGGAVVARAAVDGEWWRREVGIAEGDVDVGRKGRG